MPRDVKVLSPAEAQALLSGDGVVEEMLDGLSTVPRVSIDRTTLAAPKRMTARQAPHRPSRATELRSGGTCDLLHRLLVECIPCAPMRLARSPDAQIQIPCAVLVTDGR